MKAGGSKARHGLRTQAGNDLRRRNRRLRARLRERIAELERLNAEIRQARDHSVDSARLKSEFLANMSHEIRTPMNGVIGFTDLLMDTPLTDDQRRHLDGIRTSGESLLAIVNDVLDFSKIEAGMLTVDTIDFDLRAAVEDWVRVFEEPVRRKQVDMKLVMLENVPSAVRGDPARVRQVLANLLDNAVKFTKAGRIVVQLSTEHDDGSAVVVRCDVRDTGIGIPAELVKEVFQPFVQADGSITRQFGGTGLGLAISRRLVELMGGAIGVESTPAVGSTFWFTVPLSRRAAARVRRQACVSEVPAAEAAAASSGAAAVSIARHAPAEHLTSTDRLSILVAEDNPVNQDVTRGQLERLGYRVDVVGNGEEAVTAVERTEYAAILMDCQMPEMDGFTATAEIRRLEGTARHTPIIALTAHAMPGERDRCLHAGMDDHLAKPVKRQELALALERWVRVNERSPTAGADVGADGTLDGIDDGALEEIAREVGPEMLASFVERVLSDVSALIDRLAGRGEHVPSTVEQEAHRLLGGCRTLGFRGLGNLCEQIERDAREKGDHDWAVYRARLAVERRALVAWRDGRRERQPRSCT
jgi:signal transduction histidine kinase/DNA-binding response OmpR family regulator